MGLQEIFALLAGGIAINAVQQLQQSLNQINETLLRISRTLSVVSRGLRGAAAGARAQSAGLNAATASTQQLSVASIALGNVLSGGITQAFQLALQAATAFYERSIVSNQQLEQQITSSAIAFAQSVRVFDKFGQEITNTTDEINVLRGEFRELILDLDKATRGIPGATDQRTRAVLQNIIQQSNQIVGQEKGFTSLKDGIEQVTVALTTASAAFNLDESIQIPQEIRALLTGDVNNPNAALARQLGITRQELEKARGEGRLLAFILEKTQTLIAGNSIQAKTLSNSFSNITNVSDEFFRKLGEAAFPTFEDAFADFAQFLSDNEASFTNFAVQAGTAINAVLKEVVAFGKAFGALFADFGTELADLVKIIAKVLVPALKETLRIATATLRAFRQVRTAIRQSLGLLNRVPKDVKEGEEALKNSANAAKEGKTALEETAEAAKDAADATKEVGDGEFQFRSNEILELGSALDQVGERITNTLNRLETTPGQVERDSLAKQLTADLNTLAKSGGRDTEFIIENLQRLAQATTFSPEINLAAQQALVGVLKQQETQLNSLIALEKQRAELARFTPGITTSQAALQQIDSQVSTVEAQLEQARDNLEAIESATPGQNFAQLESAITSALQSGTLNVRQLQQEFEGLDSAVINSIVQVKKLEQQLEQSLAERATKVFKAVNDELTQIQQRAEASITGVSLERQVELQNVLNQGLVREEEVAVERLKLEKETNDAQLELAKGRLQQLEQLELSADPAERAKQELQIQETRNEVTKLTLRSLEQELGVEKQIRQIAIQRIQEEESIRQKTVQTTQTIAQADIARFDFANKSLQRQLKLIEAQNQLIQARQDLQQANAERTVSDLERAIQLNQELANPRIGSQRREEAEEELRQLGLQGVKREELQERRRRAVAEQKRLEEEIAKAQQEAASKALEADIKRNQLALQRQQIEAEIAIQQAKAARASLQAERARAIATTRDPDLLSKQLAGIDAQLKAQDQIIGLREKELGLVNQQIKDEQTLSQTRRETLAAQQEAQQVRAGGRRTSRIINRGELSPGEQVVGEQIVGNGRPDTDVSQIQRANQQAAEEVARAGERQQLIPDDVRQLFEQQFKSLADLSQSQRQEGTDAALKEAADELRKVGETIRNDRQQQTTNQTTSTQQNVTVNNNFPSFDTERFNLRLNGK